MPDLKRPLKVFLCHASTDKPKVRELYRYLKKRGIQPWFDEEDLVGGQDWQVEIPKALATSDAIIICLTKNSVDKEGYIQKEIKFALDKALEMPEGRIFLIPIKFEDCEVPFTLSRYQWVDLTVESGYAKMMKALKFRASQLERNTVQLPKNEIDEDKLAIEKISRERAEKDASEKARLEVEEQKRQKVAKEKAEHETAEREKAELIAIEKAAREKEEAEKEINRRLEKSIKKAKRDLWWEKLKIGIRYRFRMIYIYRVPILILLVTLALVTPMLIRLSNLIPEVITTFNNTPTATIGLTLDPQSSIISTEAFIPLEILTPSPTSTEILIATPASLSTEITDAKDVSMVLVPSGEFTMGMTSKYISSRCENSQDPVKCANYYENSLHGHNIYLYDYYIDKFEVTNELYKVCVDENVCIKPYNAQKYSKDEYANHPVTFVDWYQAEAYCKWRGARLPSEAEWEKAARGADSPVFPWGDEISCTNANYSYGGSWSGDYCVEDTTPVGSYEAGKSPYGIYDMAGNVWEWVADWYSESYYLSSPYFNPFGPDNGNYKVIRGGSLISSNYDLQVFSRRLSEPSYRDYIAGYYGFRCARDINP